MNRYKLFFLSLLFFCSIQVIQAQEIRFKSNKSASGTMDKRLDGIYSWGAWHPEEQEITINLTVDSVYVGNKTYIIIEHPKRWIIKKNMKYVSFACADINFSKVNVKLFQYDNGQFRIHIMEEKGAKKYSVRYLGEKGLKMINNQKGSGKENKKDSTVKNKKDNTNNKTKSTTTNAKGGKKK